MELIKKLYFSLLFLPSSVLAAPADSLFGGGSGGPATTAEDLKNFILRIETLLLSVAGVLAIAMIIYGAVLFLTAGGNEEQLGKGKDVLKKAFLGLALIISSHFLVVVFVKFLGGGVK